MVILLRIRKNMLRLIIILAISVGLKAQDTLPTPINYQKKSLEAYKVDLRNNETVMDFYVLKEGDSVPNVKIFGENDILYNGEIIRVYIDMIWTAPYLDYWLLQTEYAKHGIIKIK